MYYLKKLLALSITFSGTNRIFANSEDKDERRRYMDQRLESATKENLQFLKNLNKKEDPSTLTCKGLEADTRATRLYMAEYLKSKYESDLNEYNSIRLQEYNKLLSNLEIDYFKTQDSADTILKEYEEIKTIIERRRLTASERNNTIIQLNFLIEKLIKKINMLRELIKETQILTERWNDRSSKIVTDHQAKIFDPINRFPVTNVNLSNDLMSYNIPIFDAYLAALNVFTKKHDQETNSANNKALLAIIDNFLNAKAENDYQKRLQELITEFRDANISAIKNLDSQKDEIIKKSILESMPDSFNRDGVDFNLRNESLELANKANNDTKILESKLQEIKDTTEIISKNLGQDLQKMLEAKNINFVKALNQKRDLDLKISIELDREAQRIILEKGTQITDSFKKENITMTEEAYSNLSEIFQNDALLAEKYLKGTLYDKEKDFLFNDKEFLNSYPINSWSVFIRHLFSETISQ
jgi:hypothetical protein